VKIVATYEPDAGRLAQLRAAAPGASIRVVASEAEAREAVADADAILGNRFLVQSLPYARRLRWVQSASMGVDRIVASRDLLRGAVLTCVRGIYEDDVAEHATALALSLARGLHRARDRQRERRWDRPELASLSRMRALVLGWGGIGRTTARRLAAFGTRVEGVRRRHDGPPAPDETGFVVHGAAWREALPSTNLLVVALPLTPATRGIVGAAELALLPPGAFLVAVGRGRTIDEDALLAALRSGRLGGAALDVFAEEPLPPGHPFWDESALVVSPHTARGAERPPYRWEPLFAENLRRFANGEPLLHVVDLDAGY
jgi:phosphoglycerate dehydrogenase-like enzyme